ncbi:MAG: hypothetical protein KME46_00100 [Brasilonema angustatum HA4187-MV1]|jgi:hypothetical protein|nr:hypothetical protein [Brasilonema angustatum HA4187-MV1]
MTVKDYLTQFIETLERIRSRLISLQSSEVQQTVLYLGLAIESLKTYQASNKQFEPKPPPQTNIYSQKKSTIKESSEELQLSQQFSYNGRDGYSWVKQHYRNGRLVIGHWRKKSYKRKKIW